MFFDDVPKFLFPQKCIFCGRYGDYICDICIRKLEKLEEIKLIKFQNKNLDFLIYFFKYEKLIRKLILSYKFFDKPYMAEVFSKIIVKNEKICGKLKFYDIITSVPMYEIKKARRGYNQTELLSKSLAQKLDVLYNAQILEKIVDNSRQSSLNIKARQDNVRGAFKVQNTEIIKNKNVILVDDIYTSGATLEECSKILKTAGAKSVLGLVIAKD